MNDEQRIFADKHGSEVTPKETPFETKRPSRLSLTFLFGSAPRLIAELPGHISSYVEAASIKDKAFAPPGIALPACDGDTRPNLT